MSTTVTYKGSTLTTVENATKKLTTQGTWLEDDITITDVTSGGGSVIVVDTPDSHGGTIREITATNTVNLQGQKAVTLSSSPQTITPDTGYNGFESVVVPAVNESVWMSAPEPTDGKIHVWICLTDDMEKTVDVYAGDKNSDSVDFGDGSSLVNMESSGGSYRARHTYASAGVYNITVNATVLPANNNLARLSANSVDSRRLMRRVFLPSTFTGEIGQYKFQNAYAIEKITFGNCSVLEMYLCQNNYALREIVLPEGVTTINNAVFQNSNTTNKVVIPSTVTYIGSNAFNGCYSNVFHIKPISPPDLANANAFSNTSNNKVFYVPYSADHSILSAYQTATNWATFASYMQEEPQS